MKIGKFDGNKGGKRMKPEELKPCLNTKCKAYSEIAEYGCLEYPFENPRLCPAYFTEKEYCKWNMTHNPDGWYCYGSSCGKYYSSMIEEEFEYCPYCGKEIKELKE
jgi:hypothetical protein